MADEIDQPEPLFPLIGEIERPLVEKIAKEVRRPRTAQTKGPWIWVG